MTHIPFWTSNSPRIESLARYVIWGEGELLPSEKKHYEESSVRMLQLVIIDLFVTENYIVSKKM